MRVVFNDVIADRQAAHRAGKPFPSAGELSKRLLTEAKRTPERAWLVEVSAVPLQQALADADRAYRSFFASLTGKRRGRRIGAPRFKTKRGRQSAQFTRNAGFTVSETMHDVGFVTLPKIGRIRFVLSRPLPSAPSSVTVIREADGRHYVSFVVEAPAPAPVPETGQVAGVDVGLTDLAVIAYSDGHGEKVANPRWLARKERALARTRMGKSVHDAGWSILLRLLQEKATTRGREVRVVDRWEPTSQVRSMCGAKGGPKPLHVPTWTCLSCGTVLDRDFNAAANIMVTAGLTETLTACGGTSGCGLPERTPVKQEPTEPTGPPRRRRSSSHSGGGGSHNVSYALFGGTAPFVATFLIAQTGNRLAPAIYLTVVAAGALVAIHLMPETNRRVMDDTAPLPVVGQEERQGATPPGPDGTCAESTRTGRASPPSI